MWGKRAHHKSQIHDNNFKKWENCNSKTSSNKNNDESNDSLTKKVIKFEVDLSNFIVQNHLSFVTGDKILQFM